MLDYYIFNKIIFFTLLIILNFTAVIIFSFLFTLSTAFEYKLVEKLEYNDKYTGRPCIPTQLNSSRIALNDTVIDVASTSAVTASFTELMTSTTTEIDIIEETADENSMYYSFDEETLKKTLRSLGSGEDTAKAAVESSDINSTYIEEDKITDSCQAV